MEAHFAWMRDWAGWDSMPPDIAAADQGWNALHQEWGGGHEGWGDRGNVPARFYDDGNTRGHW